MMKLRLVFLALALLSGTPAFAKDLSIHPFVKGSFAEIKKQYEHGPFIVVFWSESCAYCMKELAMFGKLHKQYSDVEVITVATDPFLNEETVRDVLARSGLDLQQTWVFAEEFPERIYADVYKRWRGELPVTHFFTRDQRETRHMGIVNEGELSAWLKEQSN